MGYFLFVASDYKPMPGGIAAYIDNLARGLRRLGNKIRILAVVSPEEKERIKFLQNYEEWVDAFPVVNDKKPSHWFGRKCVSFLEILRCLSLRARHILEGTRFFHSSFCSISKFNDVLDQERPSTVVFGHLDLKLYPFVLALIERQLPYGIIAHDVEVYCKRPNKPNDFIIKRTMLNGAKWLAANSHHTKSLLEMWGISNNKIIIVHPPVSEQMIKEAASSSPKVKDSDYILITICRLVKSKGIDIVLHALRILDEEGIPFQYIIAGDGEERPSLEKLADDLELKSKVQFLGHIGDTDRTAFIRMADVFVMPSRVNPALSHEGFGLAFIEAAAFGIPGVGTRAGGIPDAIVHEETGLLVTQESPKELAQALIFLHHNPEKRKEMGKAAMNRATCQFSPMVIASHFQKEVCEKIQ